MKTKTQKGITAAKGKFINAGKQKMNWQLFSPEVNTTNLEILEILERLAFRCK